MLFEHYIVNIPSPFPQLYVLLGDLEVSSLSFVTFLKHNDNMGFHQGKELSLTQVMTSDCAVKARRTAQYASFSSLRNC